MKKSKKSKYKYNTIKRRIDPDENLIHFIRHNCNKRRYLWNRYVEAYYEFKEKYNTYFDSDDANNMRQWLIDEEIEKIKDPNTDQTIKDMYCSDIILSVYKDVCAAFEIMKIKWKEQHIKGDLQFKKYDPFRRSFKVRTCNEISKITNKPKGKVLFKNTTKFKFKASTRFIESTYNIKLIEPIADVYDDEYKTFIVYDKHDSDKIKYTFGHEDIKNIVFMEELGKFYVLFEVKPYYYHEEKDKIDRKEVAGIDLGIRNPVTLYDGGDKPYFMRIDDKDMSRMHYYERKTRRLQSIMDHKFDINKVRHLANPDYPKYSKRYRKIQKRFRMYWKKIRDIRRNWRFKVANFITTHYKTIIVDEYRIPDNSKITELSNRQKRYYNHYNREHAMYYFMEILRHLSNKNDCKYIEAPKNTTRTCSCCKHINPHLPLGEEFLSCESCGKVIQRDINASINCYKSYSKTSNK